MQYYIPTQIKGKNFILSKEDKHHIINVLRMSSGDFIYLIGNNQKHKCSIKIINNDVEVLLVESEKLQTELTTKITLIYGLPRLEKFELVLQKAVELGAVRIVPFLSEFSIIKLEADRIENKLIRWNKIIKEASEQSHRAKTLEISEPISLNEIKNFMSDLNIVADENQSSLGTNNLKTILNKKIDSTTILIGPEGGFSKNELASFAQLGFKSVSLGKRILRSETAAIYLLSVLSFFFESLD